MKLKEMERNYGEPVIRMALSYMFDKGMEFCREITDEEIESVEGNVIMTKAFTEQLIRVAREISKMSLWNDILPYIKEEVGVYGVPNYKEKMERYQTIAYNAIELGQFDEMYDEEDLFCELGCTAEEFDEIMEGMSAYDMED